MPLKSRTANYHLRCIRLTCTGLMLFLFSVSIFAESSTHDRDLADAYVAAFLQDRGLLSDAHLLEVALEFYPTNGDALYLLGKHPTIPRKQAVEYLEKALNADYWSVYSSNAAGVELFRTYVQMKRYSRAGVLLAGYDLDFFTSPEDAVLLAAYYRTIGDAEHFKAVVEKGYSKWYSAFVPFKIAVDPEFRMLLLERLHEFEDFNPGSAALEALLPYAQEDEIEMLIQRYMGGDDFSPTLHAYGIRTGLIDPAELTVLASYGTPVSQILHFGSDDPLIEVSLDEVYSSFDGQIRFDNDKDSFYEEILHFSNGVLTSQHIDNDQDGIEDTVIEFASKGDPDHIKMNVGDTDWFIKYSEYPFVESIKRKNDSTVRFLFDQASLPLIERSAKPYEPSVFTGADSVKLIEFCTQYKVAEESSSAHMKPNDIDTVFTLDVNENGIAEYTVLISSGIRDESWDIDEDGNVDIRQVFDEPAGSMTLSLFGYKIVIKEGIPKSLKFYGQEKPLFISGDLVWIDTNPVELAGNVKPSGYFTQQGHTYYAYRFQNYIFIQSVGN